MTESVLARFRLIKYLRIKKGSQAMTENLSILYDILFIKNFAVQLL